jgi:hypothetical protein
MQCGACTSTSFIDFVARQISLRRRITTLDTQQSANAILTLYGHYKLVNYSMLPAFAFTTYRYAHYLRCNQMPLESLPDLPQVDSNFVRANK